MFRIITALALASTLLGPSEDDRGRPVILLVHGRGMVDRDTAATRKMWLKALVAGSKSVTPLPLIAERDVRVVWYADVLDPSSPAGCDYAATDPRARHTARMDPELKSIVATAGTLLSTLTSLIADSEGTGPLRALSADASFLSDARKRCASEQRLADALDRARREGRPVVLVAHSMGALVAYDYLSARADTGVVDGFVTVGSMLGASDLRRLLIGGDDADTLFRPKGVKRWTNVRNENDVFAAPISIGRDVVAMPPADETDPHELVGYLRGTITATEVLRGWCDAYGSKAPASCGSVRPAGS